MNKKILNMFAGESMSDIQRIKSRSVPAVCGAFEREVVVRNSEVEATKRTLRKAGFIIVGTGPAGPNSKKIWFNPAGVNLWITKDKP